MSQFIQHGLMVDGWSRLVVKELAPLAVRTEPLVFEFGAWSGLVVVRQRLLRSQLIFSMGEITLNKSKATIYPKGQSVLRE